MTPDSPQTSASSSAHAIDYRRLPWAARLARDYCHAFERLEPFFVGSPRDPSAWQQAIRARAAHTGPHAEIAAVTAAQLRARGAPSAALASAERLADPATVAIVTGQQAGLFGGPLFTLLKALTAVKLARRISEDYAVPAVAVFWVHAEDHDLDEISSCDVLTADLKRRTVTLPHESGSGLPASALQLTESISDALALLRDLLPETEFSGALFEQLSDAYRPKAGMVEAFSHWLDALLGAEGLIVFDASDRAAKPLVHAVLDRELQGRGETSRLAAAAGAELSKQGYHAQVTPDLNSAALFYIDGRRHSIRLRKTDAPNGNGFEVGTETVADDDLRTRALAHPDAFSPNVLLRPVLQDAMFPTVGYVAGPSELAYLAQLKNVYEQFDIPMPVIFPRVSATILDAATLKFLGRYDLAFEMLQPQDDGILNRMLEALLPDAVERTLAAAERSVGETLTAVAAEVSAVDPTLIGATDTTRGRMERDLMNLRGKVVQAAKRRDETLRRQFHRARSQAFPEGNPQDRAVGLVYFLNRYGPHVITRLLEDLPLEIGQHWLLTV